MRDLTGLRVGRLTVISFAEKRNGHSYWKCKCDCGNIHFVNTNSLKNGDIQSCGCQRSRGEAKINAILFNNNILYNKIIIFIIFNINNNLL